MERNDTLPHDDWLAMQYGHESPGNIHNRNSHNTNCNSRTTVGLSRLSKAPAKPSPPIRTSTATTWTLSSCSSSCTKAPSCSSHNTRRLDRRVGDNGYDDEQEDDQHHSGSFGKLARLSRRYRDGCLLLDKRHHQRYFEQQSLYNSIGEEIERMSCLPATNARYTPPQKDRPVQLKPPPSATSRNHRVPEDPFLPQQDLTMPVKPPLTASSKHRLRDEARKQEVSSEADQKPPAHKNRPSKPLARPHATKMAATTTNQPSLPQSPFAAAAPAVNRELREEDDPLNGLVGLDPEEVQRQQEILEDIQRRNRCSKATPSTLQVSSGPTTISSGHRARTKKTSTKIPPSSLPEASQGTSPVQTRRNSPPQPTAMLGTSRHSSASSSMAVVEDRVARLNNGKKVRVKGTRHTYKSIIKGQATLVQCPACRTVLQISHKAKMLYCMACDEVSPIGTAGGDTDAGGGANSPRGTAAALRWDDQIACILQRQEINVAHTLKQAKQIAS